jgi:N-acetylgalactosamine kinase
MGYGVFPFALEQTIQILFCVEEEGDFVEVRHVEEGVFGAVRCGVDGRGEAGQAGWGRYVVAGYRAGVGVGGGSRGVRALVSGNVPIAAGVSSSSALTVCTSVMASFANGKLQD